MVLRIYSKIFCFATLILIFIGGLVTSTGSGLAVPDWPLSYGMLFPPMVGGVLYEHGHRMAAAFVGLMTILLVFLMKKYENRLVVRQLGYAALGLIILQGLLGGITVLFFLPTAVSALHATLAQTFFILTVLIAYLESHQWKKEKSLFSQKRGDIQLYLPLGLFALIYAQLVLAAFMRHTGAGLAILDFPQMAGNYLPHFNQDMLSRINYDRFDLGLDPVNMGQVLIHFFHRLVALIILIWNLVFTGCYFMNHKITGPIVKLVFGINLLIIAQLILGIASVLSQKSVLVTTTHVAMGAFLLGTVALLCYRCYLPYLREKIEVKIA